MGDMEVQYLSSSLCVKLTFAHVHKVEAGDGDLLLHNTDISNCEFPAVAGFLASGTRYLDFTDIAVKSLASTELTQLKWHSLCPHIVSRVTTVG